MRSIGASAADDGQLDTDSWGEGGQDWVLRRRRLTSANLGSLTSEGAEQRQSQRVGRAGCGAAASNELGGDASGLVDAGACVVEPVADDGVGVQYHSVRFATRSLWIVQAFDCWLSRISPRLEGILMDPLRRGGDEGRK